jgi:hypothetical protein
MLVNPNSLQIFFDCDVFPEPEFPITMIAFGLSLLGFLGNIAIESRCYYNSAVIVSIGLIALNFLSFPNF